MPLKTLSPRARGGHDSTPPLVLSESLIIPVEQKTCRSYAACPYNTPCYTPLADSSGHDADRLTHLHFTLCPLPGVVGLAITISYSQSPPGGTALAGGV